MGWNGTGMNCYGMGYDGTEKYVRMDKPENKD